MLCGRSDWCVLGPSSCVTSLFATNDWVHTAFSKSFLCLTEISWKLSAGAACQGLHQFCEVSLATTGVQWQSVVLEMRYCEIFTAN